MLTDHDIKRIIEAEREVFATKPELDAYRDEMRESFSSLLTAVETYAKKADTYFQELAALTHKVDRLERALHKIAGKVGIDLDEL